MKKVRLFKVHIGLAAFNYLRHLYCQVDLTFTLSFPLYSNDLTWRDVQHLIIRTANSREDIKAKFKVNKKGHRCKFLLMQLPSSRI